MHLIKEQALGGRPCRPAIASGAGGRDSARSSLFQTIMGHFHIIFKEVGELEVHARFNPNTTQLNN